MSLNPRTWFSRNRSFTLFPQLPPKLREQIWICSVPPARIVYLDQYCVPASPHVTPIAPNPDTTIFKSRHMTFLSHVIGYRSQSLPPAMLSVCRESRSIAQQFYTKAFGSADIPAQTWFDFERDTLYVAFDVCYRDNFYFYTDLREDIRKVKRLAIGGIWSPLSENIWMGGVTVALIFVVRLFGSLEKVYLVDGQHERSSTANLLFGDVCPEEDDDMTDESYYARLSLFGSEEFWSCLNGQPKRPDFEFRIAHNYPGKAEYKLKKRRKSLWPGRK